jgi:hypothetical protein
MKAAVGIALMVAGVASGVYFGLWWAFIGGIADVISEIRSPDLNAMNVAIGVAKVFFSGVIGWTAALLLIVPGYAIATGNPGLPG